MKKIFVILIVFVSLNTFAQEKLRKLKVVVRDFNKEMPISVASLGQDRLNAVGLLENALFTNGFNVISKSVAKEKAKISNTINEKNNSTNQEIEIDTKSTTYYNSVYVVEITGTWRADTGCGGVVGSSITGRIIDLVNDGKLVGTFTFSQSGFEGKCTERVMNAVAYELSQLK